MLLFRSGGLSIQQYPTTSDQPNRQLHLFNNYNISITMVARDPESPETPLHRDPFNIIVVGAGIGGLLAAIGLRLDGHEVILLEQSSSFGEVGAGIRIPPNTFKILHRWGIDLTYMKKTYSSGNQFLRYKDGATLAHMPHGVPEWDFGGSYLTVHRADYHSVLLDKAVTLGVDIRGASRVVDYDWGAPAAILEGGGSVRGDLIVIADGNSRLRRPSIEYRIAILGADLTFVNRGPE